MRNLISIKNESEFSVSVYLNNHFVKAFSPAFKSSLSLMVKPQKINLNPQGLIFNNMMLIHSYSVSKPGFIWRYKFKHENTSSISPSSLVVSCIYLVKAPGSAFSLWYAILMHFIYSITNIHR